MSCVGIAPSARAPSARYAIDLLRGRQRRRPVSARSQPRSDLRLVVVDGCRAARVDIRAQLADRARQLVAPRRRFAEPERESLGGAPLRVGDAHVAGRDLQHPPRRVAELEDVAGVALDREVLVQRADERVVGLEHHAVVGDFRNRAARGQREQPRAAPAAHRRWTSSRCTSAPRRPRRVAKPSASHRARRRRTSPRSSARYGHARRTKANSSSSPYRPARGLGDDLLREHVERRVVRDDRVERRRWRTVASSAAHSTRSSRDVGNTRPFGVPEIVCPDRPTRCSSVAIRCGDPIWQTRSTWPMSMPSSSDAVATSACSRPVFSRVSASSRFSFERLP